MHCLDTCYLHRHQTLYVSYIWISLLMSATYISASLCQLQIYQPFYVSYIWISLFMSATYISASLCQLHVQQHLYVSYLKISFLMSASYVCQLLKNQLPYVSHRYISLYMSATYISASLCQLLIYQPLYISCISTDRDKPTVSILPVLNLVNRRLRSEYESTSCVTRTKLITAVNCQYGCPSRLIKQAVFILFIDLFQLKQKDSW